MYKIIVWFCITAGLILLALPSHLDSYNAPVEPVKPPVKEYAEQRVNEVFGGGWAYFDDLITRESRWKSNAQNPTSTAYGLGQFLNSTWKTVGCVKTNDPYKQIDCTIAYVEARYGYPQKAIEHHNRKNWY